MRHAHVRPITPAPTTIASGSVRCLVASSGNSLLVGRGGTGSRFLHRNYPDQVHTVGGPCRPLSPRGEGSRSTQTMVLPRAQRRYCRPMDDRRRYLLTQIKGALNGTLPPELSGEAMHPDVVIDWSRSISPYRGVVRGREAGVAYLRDFLESWAEISWDYDVAGELPDGSVALATRITGTGAGSGLSVDGRGGQLVAFEDGLVSELTLFQSADDALAGGQLRERRARLQRARLYFVCEALPNGRDPEPLLEAAIDGGRRRDPDAREGAALRRGDRRPGRAIRPRRRRAPRSLLPQRPARAGRPGRRRRGPRRPGRHPRGAGARARPAPAPWSGSRRIRRSSSTPRSPPRTRPGPTSSVPGRSGRPRPRPGGRPAGCR